MNRSTWLKNGATTLGKRLNNKVKEILKDHTPDPLNSEAKNQINQILSQAA